MKKRETEEEKFIRLFKTASIEDKNMIIFILKYKPKLYIYLNKELTNDEDILDTYNKYKNNSYVVDTHNPFKPNYIRTDINKKVKEKEEDKFIRLLRHANIEEKNMVLFILKYYPSLYKYVNEEVKNDVDVINLAFEKDYKNILYIDEKYLKLTEEDYVDLLLRLNIEKHTMYINYNFNSVINVIPDEILNSESFLFNYLTKLEYKLSNQDNVIYYSLKFLRKVKRKFSINKGHNLYDKYIYIENLFKPKLDNNSRERS